MGTEITLENKLKHKIYEEFVYLQTEKPLEINKDYINLNEMPLQTKKMFSNLIYGGLKC